MSEHSLELPLQDNSNEYKKHTILDKNEEIHPKIFPILGIIKSFADQCN